MCACVCMCASVYVRGSVFVKYVLVDYFNSKYTYTEMSLRLLSST